MHEDSLKLPEGALTNPGQTTLDLSHVLLYYHILSLCLYRA